MKSDARFVANEPVTKHFNGKMRPLRPPCSRKTIGAKNLRVDGAVLALSQPLDEKV